MNTTEKKRGRPQKGSQTLDENAIINTAKRMMRDDKKVPSIRAIATELKVDAMALYYYFNNKAALLEAITTSLVSDVYQPTGCDDWKRELSRLSKSYLTILSQYDGLLQTLLSMQSDSPAKVFIARYETIVGPLGLDTDVQKHFLDLLVDYLHGFSIALSCDQTGELNLDYMDQPIALMFNGLTITHENKATQSQ